MHSRNLRETLLDLATALTTACVLVLLIVVIRRPRQAEAEAGNAFTPSLPVSGEAWDALRHGARFLGPVTAPFVAVEFGDYECPACGAFSRSWEAFEAAHPGQVVLLFRHYPLSIHRFAYPAARAAECAAAQGRYPEVHKLLMASQDSLGLIPFVEIGRRGRIPDLDGFESCLASTATMAIVEEDRRLGQEVGVQATPTVFVNGVRIPGLPDSSKLETLFKEHQKQSR